jgi:hypothetical protein
MSATVSKCPEIELLGEYMAIKDKVTVDEMTADQVWVYCHIKECIECRDKVENQISDY